MRIAIIQNPEETSSEYAGYISGLLADYATWLGYEICMIDSISEQLISLFEKAIIFEDKS